VVTPRNGPGPFDFQHHFYNQSHPDIPRFLERLRAADGLLRRTASPWPRWAATGRRGDEALHRRRATRLNSAYGFHFLYARELTPALIHATMRLWAGLPRRAGPAGPSPTTTLPARVSRWLAGRDPTPRAPLMLLWWLAGATSSLPGGGARLAAADVPFEQLQDPEAIANWPETLGRTARAPPFLASRPARTPASPMHNPGCPSTPARAAGGGPAAGRSRLHADLTAAAARYATAGPRLRTAGSARSRPAPPCSSSKGRGREALALRLQPGRRVRDWRPGSGGWVIESVGDAATCACRRSPYIAERRV
jgi:alpha-glucosidase